MINYFEIGKIANTHGVKGEIKILPLTDDPKRFESLKWIYISAGISDDMKKFDIECVKYHKNFVILKIKDINDIESAQILKEQFIIIDRENSVKLPKDTYFVSDLIGFKVYDECGKSLGVLKDILQTGSNDVYVVLNEDKKELLIPALKSVVQEVSIDSKKITVILPLGLIDDEV